MLSRFWTQVRLVFAALLVLTPALAAALPQQQQRIVAVGDLHGDYSAWRDIARAAGLIGRNGEWTGGRTTLVQVGDMVDRGPDSLLIVRDLMRLQKQAPRSGGKVIVLIGNHEAMNIIGDLRYVTPGEYAAFKSGRSAELRERLYEAKKADIEAKYRARDETLSSEAIRELWLKDTPLGWTEHRLAWNPDGEVGRWVISNPAAALVDGNLFVHGGISAEYAKLSLSDINRKVAEALKATDRSTDSIVSSPLGPLWYRGNLTRDPKATEIPPAAQGSPPRPGIEDELGAVLAAYKAKRLIVGHTPSLDGIRILNGGKLVAIDSGISRHYGGPLTYLEILGDRLIPRNVERSKPVKAAGK